ncbi:MAG: hypothetical protein O2931_15380, partial [Planctomycetota bacterium]|nr:hypothetical protein [Planctomycetota bacterium]
ITFMQNGQLDANDNYAGTWWFESGAIHMQWWEEDPPSLAEYVFPKRQEYVYAVKRNEENRPSVMQGVNVVLTPSSRRNQQRTSPNKVVESRGASGGF